MGTMTKHPREQAIAPERHTVVIALTRRRHPRLRMKIRRYLTAGYRVVCVFLTRGEQGGENGTVRAGEAEL
jgi:hypothetical protein